MGHGTQNEMLDCLAEMVRNSIINEVAQSEAFSIMVDETKDISKKEQMSFVIRNNYNGSILESFLAFEAPERLDAASLSQKIIQLMQKYGLDYRNHLVGQGYDGGSVMSGKNTGVQARIKAEAPLAFYVHCNAHCLNLVLVDSVKCLNEADCFFSLLQRLYVFVSGSHVHQKWLEVQREMYQWAPRELQRLIETRWACRYNACKTVKDRLPAIMCLLKRLSEERNGDRATEARGLLAQIDLQFIALLLTMTQVFGKIKHLSDALQSPQLNLGVAVTLVDSLVDTLNSYREGSVFNEIWDNAMALAEQCSVGVASRRQVTPSSRLEGYYISTPIAQRQVNTDKESFRTGSFIPILDVLLSEIRRRFSKESCVIMEGIQALNPGSSTFCEKTVILALASQYKCNTEDLEFEIPQLKRILGRKQTSGLETPSSLLDLTVFLEPYGEVFPEMFKQCLNIALALPVSTAACERSFSVLKLVKTVLRISMSDERLSNLGVLSIESKRSKAISLDDFVDVFAKRHNNRRIILL